MVVKQILLDYCIEIWIFIVFCYSWFYYFDSLSFQGHCIFVMLFSGFFLLIYLEDKSILSQLKPDYKINEIFNILIDEVNNYE